MDERNQQQRQQRQSNVGQHEQQNQRQQLNDEWDSKRVQFESECKTVIDSINEQKAELLRVNSQVQFGKKKLSKERSDFEKFKLDFFANNPNASDFAEKRKKLQTEFVNFQKYVALEKQKLSDAQKALASERSLFYEQRKILEQEKIAFEQEKKLFEQEKIDFQQQSSTTTKTITAPPPSPRGFGSLRTIKEIQSLSARSFPEMENNFLYSDLSVGHRSLMLSEVHFEGPPSSLSSLLEREKSPKEKKREKIKHKTRATSYGDVMRLEKSSKIIKKNKIKSEKEVNSEINNEKMAASLLNIPEIPILGKLEFQDSGKPEKTKATEHEKKMEKSSPRKINKDKTVAPKDKLQLDFSVLELPKSWKGEKSPKSKTTTTTTTTTTGGGATSTASTATEMATGTTATTTNPITTFLDDSGVFHFSDSFGTPKGTNSSTTSVSSHRLTTTTTTITATSTATATTTAATTAASDSSHRLTTTTTTIAAAVATTATAAATATATTATTVLTSNATTTALTTTLATTSDTVSSTATVPPLINPVLPTHAAHPPTFPSPPTTQQFAYPSPSVSSAPPITAATSPTSKRSSTHTILSVPCLTKSTTSKTPRLPLTSMKLVSEADFGETGGSLTERTRYRSSSRWLKTPRGQPQRQSLRLNLRKPSGATARELELHGVKQPSHRPQSMHFSNERLFSLVRSSKNAETDFSVDEFAALRKAITAYDQQSQVTVKAKDSDKAKEANKVTDYTRPARSRMGKQKGGDGGSAKARTIPPLAPNFKLPTIRPVFEISKENLRELPTTLLVSLGPVVTNLMLSQNQLEEIPPEIGMFTKLEELDLSSNHLSRLPPTFTNCTALKSLLIGGNAGLVLNPNLYLLSNLTVLSLTRNRMTELPDAVCELPNLQHMDISFNQLKTLTPKIGGLTKMCTLVAKNNLLVELPKEIGKCVSLSYLDLKENYLTDLPGEIGNLSRLEELCVSMNRITALPKEMKLSNFPSLYKLDTFRNQIRELTDEFFEGAEDSAFEEIHFGRNHLTHLPDGFWSCRFVLIDLKNNNLSSLPPQVGNLYQLAICDLGHNRLTHLPPEIGNCQKLITLNLFGNQLQSLPPEFVHIADKLRHLYLGYNKLSNVNCFLPDPSNGGRVTTYGALEELHLSGNPVPHLLVDLSKSCPLLRGLFLNNMELTEVPTEIAFLEELEQLDLSHNKIFSLPLEIVQLRSLYSLDVSHNLLVNTNVPESEGWDTVDWSFDLLVIDMIDLSFNQLDHLPNGVDALIQRGVQVAFENNPGSTPLPASSAFKVGWSEMVGRRPTQEDALCVTGKLADVPGDVSFFGLFDGHAGRAAAAFAAEKFSEFLSAKLSDESDPLKALNDAFQSVNSAFRAYSSSSKDSTVKHCGTTGVGVMIMGNDVYCCNVGDARSVMYIGGDEFSTAIERPFASDTLCSPSYVVRLSEDHKPDLEEERIRFDGGYVTESRVNGFLAVSRSIGDFYVQSITCETSGFQFSLPKHEDAFILICCDGVWDELSDCEACSIVHLHKNEKNLHKICTKVRDYAFNLGSDDNISVMVVKLK